MQHLMMRTSAVVLDMARGVIVHLNALLPFQRPGSGRFSCHMQISPHVSLHCYATISTWTTEKAFDIFAHAFVTHVYIFGYEHQHNYFHIT